jgi:hypothetical protein
MWLCDCNYMTVWLQLQVVRPEYNNTTVQAGVMKLEQEMKNSWEYLWETTQQ